ncbi:hypothetical protein [Mycolicibacterium phage J1]|nr:hypothetical protein [Mycolicibacterium phage J1]
MRIGEIIKSNDINTYRRLKDIGKKKIKLGDRPEELMKHNSYRRCGRRIRQIKWG